MDLSVTIMVLACLLAIEDEALTLDEQSDCRRTPPEESQRWQVGND